MNKTIHIPKAEENEAALKEFFTTQKRMNSERVIAAIGAVPALKRLCKVMCNRSGQCYKVRALLYSLWNGKPASISEVLNLDWDLRQDLCAVVLAFGFEDRKVKFFYRELENEVRAVSQWDWFLQERFEINAMEEYVKAIKREDEQT